MLKTALGKDCSDTFIETKINQKCKVLLVLIVYHHNTVEFLVAAFPNSTITLSKYYSRRTSSKAIVLQASFLDALP